MYFDPIRTIIEDTMLARLLPPEIKTLEVVALVDQRAATSWLYAESSQPVRRN